MAPNGADCSAARGTLTDNGYNLTDGSGCGLSAAKEDTVSTDPKLQSLASNGGLAQTMALLAGSPAIEANVPPVCCSTGQ